MSNPPKDKCILTKVDGVNVLVRTSEDKITEEGKQDLRNFINYVKWNEKNTKSRQSS